MTSVSDLKNFTVLACEMTEYSALEKAQKFSMELPFGVWVYWHKTKKRYYLFSKKMTKHRRVFICQVKHGDVQPGTMGCIDDSMKGQYF